MKRPVNPCYEVEIEMARTKILYLLSLEQVLRISLKDFLLNQKYCHLQGDGNLPINEILNIMAK